MTVAQMNQYFNTGLPSFYQAPTQTWRVFQADNVQVNPLVAPGFSNSWPQQPAQQPQAHLQNDDVVLLDQDPHAPLVLPPPPPMPLLIPSEETQFESRQFDDSRWDKQYSQSSGKRVDSASTQYDKGNLNREQTSGEASKNSSRTVERQQRQNREPSPRASTRRHRHSVSPVRSSLPTEKDKPASEGASRDREVRRERSQRNSVDRRRSPVSRGERSRRERDDVNRARQRSAERRRSVIRSRSPRERRRSPVRRRRTRSPIDRPSRERRGSPRTTSRRRQRTRSPVASRRRQRTRSPVASRRRSSRENESRQRDVTSAKNTVTQKQKEKPTTTASPTDTTTKVVESVDSQLLAFAKNYDADEFRMKLRLKMMSKLKDESNKQDQPLEEGSEEGEVITPKSSSTDIRLYYDKPDDTESDNPYNPASVASEVNVSMNVEHDSNKTSDTEVNDDWDTDRAPTPIDQEFVDVVMTDATETPAYPWFVGAPIQQKISANYLQSTGKTWEQRPQQPEQDGIVRTFPIKKRNATVSVNSQQKHVQNYDATFEDTSNNVLYAPLTRPTSNTRFHGGGLVKESGKGFLIRGNGTLSWVRRDKYSDAVTVPRASAPDLTAFANGFTTECYEYMQTKKCQAGALCRFTHDGDNNHHQVAFCHRFLNGLCRNKNCAIGSHALLPHQIPVCEYFLNRNCPHRTGCTFLHVKQNDATPLCIHFNKGRCLAKFPCTYRHRYTPAVIRERCNHPAANNEDQQRTDEEAENTPSNNFDDITPLNWYQ